SCLAVDGTAGELVQYKEDTADKKLKDDCDVFMQIKPYSDKKLRVTIDVKSATEPITDSSVTLSQKDTLFECKKDVPIGPVPKKADGDVLSYDVLAQASE
ncbi:hypothetical protein PFISCL1PPCAC_7091, partial [Pristionchus fissidentatus]